MSAGMLAFEPTTNAQDWSAQIEVINDDTGTPYPLEDEGFTVAVELRDARASQALAASTADGRVTFTPTGFAIDVPASVMRQLRAGTYAVNGLITAPTGEVVQVIHSSIGIMEGGFK